MGSRLGRLVDSSLAVYRARSVCRTLLWGRAGDSCDRSSPELAVQWRTDGGRSALAQGRSALRLAALAGRRVPAVHRALSGRGGSGECHGPGVSGSEGAADCSLQCKPHENTEHETEGVRRPAVTDRQPGQARGAGARGRGAGGRHSAPCPRPGESRSRTRARGLRRVGASAQRPSARLLSC